MSRTNWFPWKLHDIAPRRVRPSPDFTLKQLGYDVIRQKGSHVRLLHPGPPAHTITVPQHDSLKTGTLRGILAEIAQMRSITVQSLVDLL